MSNVYTTLSQADDKLSALQSMASIAAAQIEAGAQSHGTGAILEVALIASAITQGAISYTSAKTTYTFDTAKAIEAARVIYSRYAREYGEGSAGAYPFGAEGKELNAWRNRTLAMLHPYKHGEKTYEWTTTSKVATTDAKAASDDGTPDQKAAAEQAIQDAFDKTDKARVAARKLWDIACLYVALDDNGALLQNSNTDPKATKAADFGLRMRVSFFIPYKKIAAAKDVTKEVLLTPVDRRSGAIYHYLETATGAEYERDFTRISLDSFDSTWKLAKPKPVVVTNDWKAAFTQCALLNPVVTLDADTTHAFRAALNAMIDYSKHLEVLAKGPQPEAVADPETMKASDIASGKSLPSRMRVAS
jgi:hypothetical protein